MKTQGDLLEEAFDRIDNLDDWVERKPDFWRKKDGSMELELSPGHTTTGEGPYVKVLRYDPNKGKKGGMRVVEKLFVEE